MGRGSRGLGGVVFDYDAPNGLAGEHGARCRVVGARESADDWLAREAVPAPAPAKPTPPLMCGSVEPTPPSFEPYWLVTSDRELRARVGAGAERTVGGGSFLGELLGYGT